MEKEFIPYEQALALKELGFDEECLGRFDPLKVIIIISRPKNNSYYKGSVPSFLATPLYQQAFRWFREKYNLIFCNDYGSNEYFYWIISKDEEIFFNNEDEKENVITYKTYEEAELECLKKLIEIVKNK